MPVMSAVFFILFIWKFDGQSGRRLLAGGCWIGLSGTSYKSLLFLPRASLSGASPGRLDGIRLRVYEGFRLVWLGRILIRLGSLLLL